MSRSVVLAGVDLGASSGRVMAGVVEDGSMEVHEVHRFPNIPYRAGGALRWSSSALQAGVLEGVARLGRRWGGPRSIGIDAWGVDYGLLDRSGQLLADPVHYRDPRTVGALERILDRVSAEELYTRTGIQLQAFNTLCQLSVDTALAEADSARLIPDLVVHWLTGQPGTEVTNASTTQMIDAATGEWDQALLSRLDLPDALFPATRFPGDPAGLLRTDWAEEAGLRGTVGVMTVASHDTASAVTAVPAGGPDFAYISCGTWALVGVELDAAVLAPSSLAANFTNERGIDGTVRYLRNVNGLWLLQECERAWAAAGLAPPRPAVLEQAGAVVGLAYVVDVSDPIFSEPGDMPARLRRACRRAGRPEPISPPEQARCVLDSLAVAFRRAVRQASSLSGRSVGAIHLVGGGAALPLLCQLTADACGLDVYAGPVEATAWGNLLVQARAADLCGGTRWDLRGVVRHSEPPVLYRPTDRADWDEAEARLPAHLGK